MAFWKVNKKTRIDSFDEDASSYLSNNSQYDNDEVANLSLQDDDSQEPQTTPRHLHTYSEHAPKPVEVHKEHKKMEKKKMIIEDLDSHSNNISVSTKRRSLSSFLSNILKPLSPKEPTNNSKSRTGSLKLSQEESEGLNREIRRLEEFKQRVEKEQQEYQQQRQLKKIESKLHMKKDSKLKDEDRQDIKHFHSKKASRLVDEDIHSSQIY